MRVIVLQDVINQTWPEVQLRGVTIFEGEGAILGENVYPTSLIPLIIANWTGPCSGPRQGQTLHCKRWMSPLLAAKWGWVAHRGRSLIFAIALF